MASGRVCIYIHIHVCLFVHILYTKYTNNIFWYFFLNNNNNNNNNNNKIKHTTKRHCVYNLYIKYAQTTYLVYIHERVNGTS
jgi:hypothetical protein